MSDFDDLQELLFFLTDDLEIEVEMPYGEFEAVQSGAATLTTLAGRTAKVVYAGVGDELVVRGMVLFHLEIDAEGALASSFNLPLKHLLQHAGAGPNLGHGPIRLASRAQCPVPWHARQLWTSTDAEPLQKIQHAVMHNARGLLPRRPPSRAASDVPYEDSVARAARSRAYTEFTPSGVSTDGLRHELTVLRDKLRDAQEEMERLRAALRHEQDRNRRLQDRMLDGGR
jgi:hypothetical protein